MDIKTVLVVSLLATIALVAATYFLRPGQRRIAVRGAANALVAGLVVGAIAAVAVALFFNGKDIFGVIGMVQALGIGLLAGAAVGAGYAWLNFVVLEIGLWLRPSESWARGAVFATPVLIAAVGFGYGSYSAYQAQQAEPTIRNGSVDIAVDGQRLGHVTAAGPVVCTIPVSGGVSLNGTFTSSDGGTANVQVGLRSGKISVFALAVEDAFAGPGKGWALGPDTVQLAAGSDENTGELTFEGIVPLTADGEPDPTERWSGTLSWDCRAF